jgi:hypothetical protein
MERRSSNLEPIGPVGPITPVVRRHVSTPKPAAGFGLARQRPSVDSTIVSRFARLFGSQSPTGDHGLRGTMFESIYMPPEPSQSQKE